MASLASPGLWCAWISPCSVRAWVEVALYSAGLLRGAGHPLCITPVCLGAKMSLGSILMSSSAGLMVESVNAGF